MQKSLKAKGRSFIKKISKLVFSRTLIILLMILVQILIFPFLSEYLSSYFSEAIEVMELLGGVLVIIIINQDEPAEFKLTWAILICLFPLLGAMIYLFVKSNWGILGLKRKVSKEQESTRGMLYTSEHTHKVLATEDKSFQNFAYYMEHNCGFPVYHNTSVRYFPLGEDKIEDLKKELKNAEHFIFLEYFIIDRGQVWDSILEILKEKAREGVDVRVMYDGLCSLLLLPYGYPKKLKAMGLKAKAFAPIVPFLSTTQNNRDHRKIVVIDGKIAYTGGVNLADEYANLKDRFGHWKDVGIKLEGRGVMTFTMMFLQNWNLYGDEDVDYEKFLKYSVDYGHAIEVKDKGFVIPYGDTPTMQKEIGKNVYEDIFDHAKRTLYVMTPYFIVDREFLSTIKYAGLRGVDVRIILPHVPDKKYAFDIARTFYPDLLSAGIKVYEYTPGFVHAKVVAADGIVATVGSVNLDYRSFYHHFECGAYIYNSTAVDDIEKDFLNTLEKCQEVTMDTYKKIPVYSKVFGRIMRIFAPLM